MTVDWSLCSYPACIEECRDAPKIDCPAVLAWREKKDETMTDDTVELKPCPNPWCDGDRLLVVWDLFSRRVICTCGVKGPRSATKVHVAYDQPINDADIFNANREAREAWNTRHALTVEDAAKVLLDAMGPSDQIDADTMDLFFDGSPFTALRAIADTPKGGE